MELYELTISEAHEKLKSKTISSLELTRSVLDHGLNRWNRRWGPILL